MVLSAWRWIRFRNPMLCFMPWRQQPREMLVFLFLGRSAFPSYSKSLPASLSRSSQKSSLNVASNRYGNGEREPLLWKFIPEDSFIIFFFTVRNVARIVVAGSEPDFTKPDSVLSAFPPSFSLYLSASCPLLTLPRGGPAR